MMIRNLLFSDVSIPNQFSVILVKILNKEVRKYHI